VLRFLDCGRRRLPFHLLGPPEAEGAATSDDLSAASAVSPASSDNFPAAAGKIRAHLQQI